MWLQVTNKCITILSQGAIQIILNILGGPEPISLKKQLFKQVKCHTLCVGGAGGVRRVPKKCHV